MISSISKPLISTQPCCWGLVYWMVAGACGDGADAAAARPAGGGRGGHLAAGAPLRWRPPRRRAAARCHHTLRNGNVLVLTLLRQEDGKGQRNVCGGPLTCAAQLGIMLLSLMNVTEFLAGFTLEDNLVCTVGSAAIWPGASNVIPGSANFTVDVRCRSDGVREAVVADVTSSIAAICSRCAFCWGRTICNGTFGKNTREAVAADVTSNISALCARWKPSDHSFNYYRQHDTMREAVGADITSSIVRHLQAPRCSFMCSGVCAGYVREVD